MEQEEEVVPGEGTLDACGCHIQNLAHCYVKGML
jgi:hypothetical protein